MKICFLFLVLASFAQSQTPNVSHAQFETRAATGDAAAYLRDLIKRDTGPAWVGYSVPSQEKDNDSCCWDDRGSGCRLEGGAYHGISADKRPLQLEGSRNLFVLLRLENHAIGKIHPVSESCPLDAGGLPFI